MKIRLPILALAMASATLAQEATAGSGPADVGTQRTRPEWIAELRSQDAGARSQAFERLRSDPVALRDPGVKAALVNLLDRENQVRLSAEDEGYAEYRSWLSDTVAKVIDWNNPHQVCILANSVDLPDQLADHAKVTVPCHCRDSTTHRLSQKGTLWPCSHRLLQRKEAS
jgi:hypothetical protein